MSLGGVGEELKNDKAVRGFNHPESPIASVFDSLSVTVCLQVKGLFYFTKEGRGDI